MSDQPEVDTSNFVPKLGNTLHGPAIRVIIEAVEKRQEKFDEELGVSLGLVLMNIGDRYQPLRCEGKEWRGLKKDILPGEGQPTCPNGHALIKERGLTLGWVMDRE